MLEFVKILGVKINPLTMEETLVEVEKYLSKEKPLHLMGVNADKINLCISNPKIKKIVNESEIINADGASVVLASKYLGYSIPERVAGIDLMQELLLLSESKNYSVYFLGAKEEIVLKMLERFKTTYPNLKVAGHRNGYFSDDEIDIIQEEIRVLKPNIVFVGITSPKKEYLIDHFLNNGLTSVFMGVGGSFDVLSGSIKRAPLWMQKANLEWLYRVMKEPKRLFKRYFVGNVEFINHVLKEKREKNGK
ncbi:WecB/TagA/CpsF family glycosyltransferase [Streptococcus pacificus]|uniref:WecB/TagA/CpsF family glycosyltransferase n=1 Tax=Streptococcus pacificus TaxID=2740577 RepID=A0ABS0ZHC8_9STRE|nr:WecB/TagA/CpsF family glycosyltransferase [Streptococcus pacificus]MBJ8325400.1 WecB/TagA/CpsF family glycosyltransferase [Streptococcus pacificus]